LLLLSQFLTEEILKLDGTAFFFVHFNTFLR
jgi:hypothetical protein